MSQGFTRISVHALCTLVLVWTTQISVAQDPNPGACITLGPNLVINPEFDDGNVEINSSYVFHPDYTCGFGQYTVASTVINDPIGGAACYSGTGFDLTSIWAASDRNDPGNGNYLILDPSDTTGGNFNMWQQTIQVCPGSDYVFSAFAKNLFFAEATFPYSGIDPIFELTINGLPPTQSYFIDGVLSPNGTFDPLPRQPIADSAVWTQISGRWSSGTNTSAVITIKNIVPGNEGNDIAIDGIFFGLCNRVIDLSPNGDIGQCQQLNTVQPVTFTVPTQTLAEGWQYYEWYKDGALLQADPNPVSFVTPADQNGEYYGSYQLRVYDDPQGPANGACGNVSKTINIFEDCPVSFPVELVAFDGRLQGDQAVLNWTTAWETNNQGFEIWGGRSGQRPQMIGYVAGMGNSQAPVTYEFLTDALKPGVYHFQLRQIDMDGAVTASDMIELEVSSLTGLMQVSVMPNPAALSAELSVALPFDYPVSAEIITVEGKVLASRRWEQAAGQNVVTWNMPVADLPEGYYLIRVKGPSQKIVPFVKR